MNLQIGHTLAYMKRPYLVTHNIWSELPGGNGL